MAAYQGHLSAWCYYHGMIQTLSHHPRHPHRHASSMGSKNMSDLKPCPFCGGAASFKPRSFKASCDKCGAHVPNGAVSSEEVIAAWNRRALPAAQPAHVTETAKSEHDERVMLTLTAERDRLREALTVISQFLATTSGSKNIHAIWEMAERARAALKGESHE